MANLVAATMEKAHFAYIKALLTSKIAPMAIPSIFLSYNGTEDTLVKLAIRAYIRQSGTEKNDEVVAVLKREDFCHFRPFIVLNNPRSSLFYFKHCVFRGYLSFHIESETLFLIETLMRDQNVFLQMNHTKREGYSMKTINKFLKISQTKELYKVVVRIPMALEKEMHMTERMTEFADNFRCPIITFEMGDDLVIVFDKRMFAR